MTLTFQVLCDRKIQTFSKVMHDCQCTSAVQEPLAYLSPHAVSSVRLAYLIVSKHVTIHALTNLQINFS